MSRWLLPLAEAGISIKSRKLKWEENGIKHLGLVERGNKFSRYGMAVEDAALYQVFCLE
jgi:hypothetical protein